MQNSRGELFGGYYSVLADIALSYTVMTVLTDNERFKTIDLRISPPTDPRVGGCGFAR